MARNKTVVLTTQDIKKLFKERGITKFGIQINLHERVSLPKILDSIQPPTPTRKDDDAWPSGWSRSGKFEERWGRYDPHKKGKYQGSPFSTPVTENLRQISSSEFEAEILRPNELPAIVKFHAPW